MHILYKISLSNTFISQSLKTSSVTVFSSHGLQHSKGLDVLGISQLPTVSCLRIKHPFGKVIML